MKKILVIGAISYCILMWLFFSGCKTESSFNNHSGYVTADGWHMHVDSIAKAKRYCCTDDCRWIQN